MKWEFQMPSIPTRNIQHIDQNASGKTDDQQTSESINNRPTFHATKIPTELTQLDQWVVWRFEPPKELGGKPRKVPYSVDCSRASSTNPDSWTTFKEAYAVYKEGNYDGLMFAITPEDNYVFVDIDKCRNAKNKKLTKLAEETVKRFDSFTETSVTGTGIHILLKGKKSGKDCRQGDFECYDQKRFVAMTGRILKRRDKIEKRQDQLEEFYREYIQRVSQSGPNRAVPGVPIPEEKLDTLLKNAKAAAIYEGERNDKYHSQSEADLALCNYAIRCDFSEEETRTLIETARKNAGAEPKHDTYFQITYQRGKGDISPISISEAREVFNKWMLCPDSHALAVVLAVVASSHLPGDPLWLHIVGPPSSGKTEHINAVDGFPTVYSLSELTPAGLVSGINSDDGIDYSLLPHLHNKTLCIKDFTPTIDAPKDVRQKLFGRLRDAFDGSQSIHTATTGTRTHRATFNCLTGVTGAIEKVWRNTSLGERYLLYRLPPVDPLKVAKVALTGVTKKQQMRAELKRAAHGVLVSVDHECVPIAKRSIRDGITRLAVMLAKSRTFIERDNHTVIGSPEPEGPARIAQQLHKLGQGLALIHGRSEITKVEVQILTKVALDSMPLIRLQLISRMLQQPMAQQLFDIIESTYERRTKD